jgi:DNA-binding beta-propeller fold protein YncE
MKTLGLFLALLAAVGGLAASAAPAAASRALLKEDLLRTSATLPPPEGEVEGACGLAVTPDGSIYVSDYYHHVVDLFSSLGEYQSQIVLAGVNPVIGINRLDSVCGLALDSGGRLYANELHQGVLRLRPSEAAIDGDQSTGVAVDAAGDLFVNDRTYVAEYAAPVEAGDSPVAEIGLNTLGDGFGLAVSPSGDRVYVADAADQTVKVYEPAIDPSAPTQTISGFRSLRNAALAVDPTNEHLLVVDNLQPGFEHPIAAIDEFTASGASLGRLPGDPIDGEPSGLAVDPASGTLYVTSGNDEGANVFVYGPDLASLALAPPSSSQTAVATGASPTSGPGASGSEPVPGQAPRRHSAYASEIVQRRGVRVKVDGQLSPRALPRRGTAPVHVSLGTEIRTSDGETPPQLRKIAIEINRNGHFDPKGLPHCRLAQIQPSTTEGALAACRASQVGEGRFSADVKLPQQSPFPAAGKVLAFSGVSHGRPVIFAHVFGTKPVPTSFTLAFAIDSTKGTYGTVLRASVPEATGDSGFITGLSLNLGRVLGSGAHRRSYISAGCPAPAGLPVATFPFARTSFSFAGGPKLTTVLIRSCKAR